MLSLSIPQALRRDATSVMCLDREMGLDNPREGETHAMPDRIPSEGPIHVPVMVEEVIEYFRQTGMHFAVDGTAGEGGHSVKLIEQWERLYDTV